MATFISYPFIALAVGGAFVAVWLWRRARSAAIAGMLWLVYGAYEYLIHTRVMCSGECNIRVDLLVIYPLLLVVSLVAVWNTARGRAVHVQTPDSPA